MQYFLVEYRDDQILQVVPKVLLKKNICYAKYLDGRYYSVKIIAEHSCKKLLNNLKNNISRGAPVIALKRLQVENLEYVEQENIHVNSICPPTISVSEESNVLTEPLRHEIIIAEDIDLPPEINLEDHSVCPLDGVDGGSRDIIILEDIIIPPHKNLGNSICPLTTSVSEESNVLTEALRHEIIIAEDIVLPPEINLGHHSVCPLDDGNGGSRDIILEDIIIPPHKNLENKTTGNQKKHCCFFCQKHVCKMYRHYITVHKDEQEVKDILAEPPRTLHRKVLLDKLRKRGDYEYNTVVKNEKRIVCRETKRPRERHVPCPNCKGYYSKLSIRHHFAKCFPAKKKGRRNIQVECRKLEKNIHKNASEVLRTQVFPVLKEDAITNSIRYDEAIIKYGNYLCRKYTALHHHRQIRANMRAFGRLILEIRKTNPGIKNFLDVLDPLHVDLIINGIDKVAGLNENTHQYQAPATAMSLATELKKLCKLMEMECIKAGDSMGQKNMENLYLIFQLEFNVTVNKKGLDTQKVNYRSKEVVLPKTDQIAQFRSFLENKIIHFTQELEKFFSLESWTCLAEYTLAHLAVFNRKRPGETQRILVEDYRNFETVDEETDSCSMEQTKKWARIRFTGKLGKNTALLIHRQLGFGAIDLILKYRHQAGVHPNNPFVFGEPSHFNCQSTFDACNLLRKFSCESKIKNPHLLRTRLLRQHLATQTAKSKVDPRLEERVSDFMSHKRQIHEDYYVMTQKTDDITKVSKLLEEFSTCEKDPVRNETDVSSSENEADETIFNREYTDSDEDKENIICSEIDNILGKKQVRRPWSSGEKQMAREHFGDEIQLGTLITMHKVNKFFLRNKKVYKHRTPHLIKQWVVSESKRVALANKEIKGRQRWSTPEKEVVRSSSERHSSEGTFPALSECEDLIHKNDILWNRTPAMVKAFIYNDIKKNQEK